MPTIDQLIAIQKRDRANLVCRRDELVAQVKSLHGLVRHQGRNELTDEETREFHAVKRTHEDIDRDIRRVDAELEELRKVRTEENSIQLALRTPGTAGAQRPAYDRVARVGSETRTYRPDEDATGSRFLSDVVANFLYRDPAASQRLGRHIDEERVDRGQYLTRAVGTGAFAGLTVPQYLTELYAPAVAAMRPFANICNRHVLPPDGMTVNISRITTASSAAIQASENAAVSETNIDDTLLTENVQTIAGQQTLSRQAVERGTGIEDVAMGDLFRRVATTLDSTLINQATTGLAPISTSQTYTNATVDTTAIPAFWKQIPQAQSTVEAAMLNQAVPTHLIMHPRRWNWVTAAVSSTWPVIAGTNVPPQSWGLNLTNDYTAPVRGQTSSGLKIVVDGNVSTVCLAQATTGGTQDHVYLVCANEMHLWEDPNAPMFIRAEQPAAASLGVLLVAYTYLAYSFRRYGSSASVVINGTGLATPSFA